MAVMAYACDQLPSYCEGQGSLYTLDIYQAPSSRGPDSETRRWGQSATGRFETSGSSSVINARSSSFMISSSCSASLSALVPNPPYNGGWCVHIFQYNVFCQRMFRQLTGPFWASTAGSPTRWAATTKCLDQSFSIDRGGRGPDWDRWKEPQPVTIKVTGFRC
jgi:hypothetical protein